MSDSNGQHDRREVPGFTPGPWTVDCNQFGSMPTCQFIVRSRGDNGVAERDGVMVVGIGDCGFDDCDGPSLTMANARLIAAAPSMFAAIKRALAIGEDDWANAENALLEAAALVEGGGQ